MGLLDNQTQGAYYASGDFGNYQFVTLENIISAFMVAYVGEGKIISKVNRTDVQFHAMRALQELSYDVLRSFKALEIDVPNTLTMALPQDYVNYTKLTRVDNDGIERVLYPTGKTSNPFKLQIDSNDEFLFDSNKSTIQTGNLVTNGNFVGGSDNWILNQIEYTSGNLSNESTTVSTDTATLGDPSQGWFYGFNGNSMGAYDLPAYWGIRQNDISIIPGEQYKIKYTVSGYTAGEWKWYIIDENGDYTNTTTITANGTYEETITAGNTNANYTGNSIIFRNDTINGNIILDSVSLVRIGDENDSTTWSSYSDPTEVDVYADDTTDIDIDYRGRRYGLDPQHTQSNGTFFIDQLRSNIHFGSALSGKTIVLHYVSDGLGTDEEMVVHKFCEEACYKWIAHGVLSAKSNIPEYIVQRFKKERFAETRKAKIRLSNIKIEEFTQILKGLSKPIK
tara:strand:+ start:2090 stop:3442 length:1353 start_codon:yes stop_codon:yes gene_type:complete